MHCHSLDWTLDTLIDEGKVQWVYTASGKFQWWVKAVDQSKKFRTSYSGNRQLTTEKTVERKVEDSRCWTRRREEERETRFSAVWVLLNGVGMPKKNLRELRRGHGRRNERDQVFWDDGESSKGSRSNGHQFISDLQDNLRLAWEN